MTPEEWKELIGCEICVTFFPSAGLPVTHCGKIIGLDGDQVQCVDDADGFTFAFAVGDVAEMTNWRGTLVAKLKGEAK